MSRTTSKEYRQAFAERQNGSPRRTACSIRGRHSFVDCPCSRQPNRLGSIPRLPPSVGDQNNGAPTEAVRLRVPFPVQNYETEKSRAKPDKAKDFAYRVKDA